MNQYVNENYYLDEFEGKIPEDLIQKYLEMSQEKIDEITFNRIVKIGFDNLTSFQQECIQKGICYQAEYMYENGTDPLSNVSSYSVLDISINLDKSTQTEAQKMGMDEEAYRCIKKTGLTCRVLR